MTELHTGVDQLRAPHRGRVGEHVSPGPRPVAKQSIVELVIDEVRRSILDGSLSASSTVSIAELSSRLRVSHIPVREALRRLEGEGLIELRRGRSAVVAPLTAEDLVDILNLRGLIESDLMARAAKLYTDADLAEIEARFEALEVGPDDNAESLSARHVAFHRLLVRPAASDWSMRLLDLLWQANERYMHLALAEPLAGRASDLRKGHSGLLDAARSRSAAAARRAVRAHLTSGIDCMVPSLAPAAAPAAASATPSEISNNRFV